MCAVHPGGLLLGLCRLAPVRRGQKAPPRAVGGRLKTGAETGAGGRMETEAIQYGGGRPAR